MPVVVIGLNHRTVPLELLERVSVSADRLPKVLHDLCSRPNVAEAVVLSTCNRLECYVGGSPDRQQVLRLIAEQQGVDADALDGHAYWHHGTAGVRHLFRVASGLESLVIGESQIVHQMKTGYEQALAGRFTANVLNPLFQRALGVAKEVRNQTAIGKHKLSVASVAVDLAKHIYGDLDRSRLLVVGAGEIAELAAKYLLSAGVREMSIVNRSDERAQTLANELKGDDFRADVLPWSMLGDALTQHDIVVTSTAAPHAVITAAEVQQAMRRRRQPLMLIDLAVPRDVEPAVADINDVYLYNIDHLETVVASNRQLRADELDAAGALVDAMVASYASTVGHDRGALMAQVAGFFNDIVAAEEARLKGKLALKDTQELRYGLERVGNKLQHQMLKYLREHADDPNAQRVIREMLGLG